MSGKSQTENELLAEMAAEARTLADAALELVRLEMREQRRLTRQGLTAMVVGGVLLLAGLLMLLGVGMLLASQAMPLWIIALFVGGGFCILGLAVLSMGSKALNAGGGLPLRALKDALGGDPEDGGKP